MSRYPRALLPSERSADTPIVMYQFYVDMGFSQPFFRSGCYGLGIIGLASEFN